MIVLLALFAAERTLDYCNVAAHALEWKPGLSCPAGYDNAAHLTKSRQMTHLTCVNRSTRHRGGPYVTIDCSGVVIARGSMVAEQPKFMTREGHCVETQAIDVVRLRCPNGTFYNRVVGDDGVRHQCLDDKTRQANGPYEERDCAGVARHAGTMAQGERTGEWSERHPNGVLASLGNYCAGRACGTWATWGPDGDLATYNGSDGRTPPQAPAQTAEPPGATLSLPNISSRTSFGFGFFLGVNAAFEPSRPVASLALGYRQEVLFRPEPWPLAVGFYLEAMTQKRFADGLYGGGLVLRLLNGPLKLLPSIGADARWDGRAWGASLTSGLYVGLHEDGLLSWSFGLRAEVRERVLPDRETAFLIILQIDGMFPLLIPLLLITAGRPWFPHG